jgi:adenosine deaminase
VEFRFAPGFVTEFNSLSWNDVLDGFEKGLNLGMRKYPEIRAGMICIAVRDYPEDIDKTVDFFLQNQKRFVGFDLAGNEVGFDFHSARHSFSKLKKAGAKITVHAGEGSGPENIWIAIDELGARRIGHGIACIQDRKLMDRLARDQICLEMCPTSNWLTQAVKEGSSRLMVGE